MDGMTDLMDAFEGVGLSRGTMNGQPLCVAASSDEGYRVQVGQEKFLKDLRAYEARKGKRGDWRTSMRMLIRSCVADARRKKKPVTLT